MPVRLRPAKPKRRSPKPDLARRRNHHRHSRGHLAAERRSRQAHQEERSRADPEARLGAGPEADPWEPNIEERALAERHNPGELVARRNPGELVAPHIAEAAQQQRARLEPERLAAERSSLDSRPWAAAARTAPTLELGSALGTDSAPRDPAAGYPCSRRNSYSLLFSCAQLCRKQVTAMPRRWLRLLGRARDRSGAGAPRPRDSEVNWPTPRLSRLPLVLSRIASWIWRARRG